MQQINRKTTVETFGQQASFSFGIDPKNALNIIRIVRDSLYSDKILAVIREYSSNAWDAHREAGIPDRPIKVTLPTRFAPIFSIRDYGLGLSETQIDEVFRWYGTSTKSSTNNAIGMFGIGSKSGFAYSDTFTIISRHNGKCITYCAVASYDSAGEILKLSEVDCDLEDTGIEIQIAVRDNDISSFKMTASNFYTYFEPQPEINIALKKVEYAYRSDEWCTRRDTYTRTNAVMGPVHYPVNTEAIRSKLSQEELKMLSSSLTLFFNIGELEVSASRENLEYTDYTINNIKLKIQKVISQIKTLLKKEYEAVSNVKEAKRFYDKFISIDETAWAQTGPIGKAVKQLYRYYNGYDLSATDFCIPHSAFINFRLSESTSSNSFNPPYQITGYDNLSYNFNYIFVVVDDSTKCIIKAKYIRDKVHAEQTENILPTKAILINRKPDDVNAETITYERAEKEISHLSDKLLIKIPVYRTSEITLPTKQIGRELITKSEDDYVYKLKDKYRQQITPPYYAIWENTDVDITQGSEVYVLISRGKPINEHFPKMLAMCFPNTLPTIYGVKANMEKKISDSWIEFNEWYMKQLSEFITIYEQNIELFKTFVIVSHMKEYNGKSLDAKGNALVEMGIPADHIIIKTLKATEQYNELIKTLDGDKLKQHNQLMDMYYMLRRLIIDGVTDYKLISYDDISREIYNLYPMLTFTLTLSSSAMATTSLAIIADYIKTIDGE